ncbi:cytochrome c oxidase assembly protein [Humidisolicoccus flavus]|uniref:cytochrome c oxidase assembly protein n=1 Tax=Humidisolicoccus flavus TaxID=3111414 RepID=UPI0032432478
MPKLRLIAPLMVLSVAVVVLLAALEFGGGAAPLTFGDAGPVVRYGIPLTKVVQQLGFAAMLGGLVFACYSLVPESKAWNATLDGATFGAGVAAVASGANAFLNYRIVDTSPITYDERFSGSLVLFFMDTERGRILLGMTLMLAVITALLIIVRSATGAAWLTVFSAAPIALLAELGHSGGTETHTIAVSGIWIHIVFAAIWLGGLFHLALQMKLTAPKFGDAVRRYSSLALVSFFLVAGSGFISAWIRVGSFEALTTPYGVLVIAKSLALLALGAFGALVRLKFLPRLERGLSKGRFFLAELVVMATAIGLASGLAQTRTPVVEEIAGEGSSAARILTGKDLPPPFDITRLFTEWGIDPLWSAICALFAFFYIAAFVRLRKRGDSWPVVRLISWLSGILLLWWCTNGSLNLYQEFQFSLHMLVHMLLGMAVPVLLVPGAPITLALRTINGRRDGTLGGREWLLRIVHSKWMSFIAHPIVAAALFIGSLWVFYYTPMFRWATTEHIGHIWMVVHFVGSGYLFVQTIIGIDPGPKRPPYPFRLLLLLAAMAGHAFFGLSIMMSENLMLADWFGAMGNGIDALADQQVGGGITWSIGEIPTITLAIYTAFMWSRSDTKEQKRLDRKADRDGDSDLSEYNAMLERMAKR